MSGKSLSVSQRLSKAKALETKLEILREWAGDFEAEAKQRYEPKRFVALRSIIDRIKEIE